MMLDGYPIPAWHCQPYQPLISVKHILRQTLYVYFKYLLWIRHCCFNYLKKKMFWFVKNNSVVKNLIPKSRRAEFPSVIEVTNLNIQCVEESLKRGGESLKYCAEYKISLLFLKSLYSITVLEIYGAFNLKETLSVFKIWNIHLLLIVLLLLFF